MKLELVNGQLTPEQMREMQKFNDVEGAVVQAWKDGQSAKWAARNPVSVADTDDSFRRRYGLSKTWAVRDAVRSVPREGRWLEVGCSAGAHMALMQSLGFQDIVGVDIGLEPLANGPYRGRCAQADARYLPFADLTFEGVTTAGSFMHLGPPDNMRECARGLTRLARRWWLLIELWSAEPHLVSFGDLLPPVWLYPWETVLPGVLGPEWSVVSQQTYELNQPGRRAPLMFLLLKRAG